MVEGIKPYSIESKTLANQKQDPRVEGIKPYPIEGKTLANPKQDPMADGKLFLEVLIVLYRAPSASPTKAMGYKETIGQVATRNLIWERGRAIAVFGGIRRLNRHLAIAMLAIIRIVKGVDVDRCPKGMGRQLTRPFHLTIAEATGVVGAHRPLIVGPEVVDQPHTLDGIALIIEPTEDTKHIGSHLFVAHQLTHANPTVRIAMQQPHISQALTAHAAVSRVRLATHAGKHLIRYRFHTEAPVHTYPIHLLRADNRPSTPRKTFSGRNRTLGLTQARPNQHANEQQRQRHIRQSDYPFFS